MQQNNYKETIKEIADIAEYLALTGSELIPCTYEEVKDVESFYKVSLPAIYKEFLLSMGKQASGYMTGSYVYYNCVFELRQMAERIIVESKLSSLNPEDFVFWSHQGYIFAYFKINAGENPLVNIVYEGGQTMIFDNLFEFFKAELHLDGFTNVALV